MPPLDVPRAATALTRQVDSSRTSTRAPHTGEQLDYWSMLFVFVLATFIGVGVIRRVSRLLHTPLMSLTNAISAIAVVGSILIAGEEHTMMSTILGSVAVAASVTNIVSGFLITDRMLKMFRDRRPKA
jgi:NAD(P) transhydrogenase subunit alpha